jgi:hypothetical protein
VDRLIPLFSGARMLTLAACQSTSVAPFDDAGLRGPVALALSAAGVPVVLALQQAVEMSAAAQGCATLYAGLARGRSVQAALAEARQKLYATGRHAWYAPALWIRSRATGPVML